MADEGVNNNRVSSSSSSKRRRLLLMTDDDRSVSSSSSVHAVVFNDDLLIEILLRLPVISLFFFKSVSKRWLSLITSPAFFNRLTRFPNIHPPSGLFLQKLSSKHNPFELDHFEHDFVSMDTRIPAGKKKKSSAFTFGGFGSDASDVRVLQSCNGLVLCVIRKKYEPDKICVYNPCINKFKMLPEVDGLIHNRNSDRLAFDPAKSPHYKVLHIQVTLPNRQKHYSILTWIYSSETGCWRKGGNSFPIEWFRGEFDRGVYWNDALHWLDLPNLVRHFKLDVEHPPDTTTSELPKTFNSRYTNKLFESRGCLLLACAAPVYPDPLEIYEMRNGYTGWSLKYIVKYEDGVAAFRQTWKMSIVWFRFDVLFIVVGERGEESFVALNLNGKVVKYNLLSRTVHLLCDIKTQLTNFCTFPFIASFAGTETSISKNPKKDE